MAASFAEEYDIERSPRNAVSPGCADLDQLTLCHPAERASVCRSPIESVADCEMQSYHGRLACPLVLAQGRVKHPRIADDE
jgi:hypothetical protein